MLPPPGPARTIVVLSRGRFSLGTDEFTGKVLSRPT